MHGETLIERVRENQATELERLGSDKALLAVTAADLEIETVLREVAAREAGVRETFEEWADAASDPALGEAFAEAAATTADEYDRVVAELTGEPADSTDEVIDHLRTVEGDVERVAAGFVGEALVRERTLLQVINFFVNEADERRANLFRDVRSTARDRVEEGGALLDEHCEDWDRAQQAAGAVVETAYASYVDRLEAMGIDPKPVC